MPRKAAGRKVKGVSKNKKQANAAEVRAAAAELAELAAQRQRQKDRAAGTAAKPTHVPQHDGRGGTRQKLDTEAMSPRSKKQIEKARVHSETFRMKQGGAREVSEAVRADPTEAWRTSTWGEGSSEWLTGSCCTLQSLQSLSLCGTWMGHGSGRGWSQGCGVGPFDLRMCCTAR
jgi:hypothetical protein